MNSLWIYPIVIAGYGHRSSGITCNSGSGVSATSPVKGRSWERMSKKVVASATENRPIATADVRRLSQ